MVIVILLMWLWRLLIAQIHEAVDIDDWQVTWFGVDLATAPSPSAPSTFKRPFTPQPSSLQSAAICDRLDGPGESETLWRWQALMKSPKKKIMGGWKNFNFRLFIPLMHCSRWSTTRSRPSAECPNWPRMAISWKQSSFLCGLHERRYTLKLAQEFPANQIGRCRRQHDNTMVIIDVIWVRKWKRYPDGAKRVKSRLCARGCFDEQNSWLQGALYGNSIVPEVGFVHQRYEVESLDIAGAWRVLLQRKGLHAPSRIDELWFCHLGTSGDTSMSSRWKVCRFRSIPSFFMVCWLFAPYLASMMHRWRGSLLCATSSTLVEVEPAR